VYPNPSDEGMTLDVFQQGNERMRIEMFNSQGQLVEVLYDGVLSSGKHLLPIERQAAGLYTVVLSKGVHTAVQRVVFR
jgi:hypothetical protein